ncbi:MAG: helix-turn-helix transcriptional regulator [Chloroflexi bacterium]|nr:helix-turn-helix transcriptional regulator [Chloroflexota bacterium]
MPDSRSRSSARLVTLSEAVPASAFGAAVRKLRRERGLSQEDFADLVGLHRTYIGDV